MTSSRRRPLRKLAARPADLKAGVTQLRLPARDTRRPVLAAMRAELERSIGALRLARHRRPYFLSYLLRQNHVANITAKAGALTEDERFRYSVPHAEVRVGSYRDDNTDPSSDLEESPDLEGWFFGPLDGDGDAIRRMFWLLTDRQYKEAVRNYLEKRGRRVTRLDPRERRVDDFSREEPARHYGPNREAEFDLDFDAWRQRLVRASRLFLAADWIEDSFASLHVRHVRQFFVNSEGSEHIQEYCIYSLHVHAATTAPKDGTPLHDGRVLNLGRASELPDARELNRLVREVVDELHELRHAPVCPPYVGPALLGPDVTGVVFHEAVGHRLEGERMRLRDEGHTFKGKIGRRILPKFIQIEDDATRREFEGTVVTGYYAQDEQGVPARPVELVRNGVLKNYLMSRTPVRGFPRSNGHGRSDGLTPAQARMAVLTIRSSDARPRAELKRRLIEECRKARRSFGLIIERIEDGLTVTNTNDFQAFVERPARVLKVNVKTGEETLVRGVEIVGTPLATINKILAMGDDYQVFNGFCGAESGDIPQSEIAPSCLVTEIELQRSSQENQRPPILPPPRGEKN